MSLGSLEESRDVYPARVCEYREVVEGERRLACHAFADRRCADLQNARDVYLTQPCSGDLGSNLGQDRDVVGLAACFILCSGHRLILTP